MPHTAEETAPDVPCGTKKPLQLEQLQGLFSTVEPDVDGRQRCHSNTEQKPYKSITYKNEWAQLLA